MHKKRGGASPLTSNSNGFGDYGTPLPLGEGGSKCRVRVCHSEVPNARNHVIQYSCNVLPTPNVLSCLRQCHCEGAKRPSQSQSCLIKKEILNRVQDDRNNGITTSDIRPPRNDLDSCTQIVKNDIVPLAPRNDSKELNDFKKKAAFTLAEVLITLGIIGVVAALTIPTLINNYQKKVLKTQFMKKYAEISQSVLLAKSETNGNFKSYCIQYDGNSYYNTEECKAMFDKYFKVVDRCKYKGDVLTYNKKLAAHVDIGALAKPTKLLSDGSCYDIKINSRQLGFVFDMNGPDKGPNALGHDIFSFHVDENDYLQPVKQTATYTEDEIIADMEDCEEKYGGTPGNSLAACLSALRQKGYPCNKASTQQGNGLGCSWFALHDVCPDDETKGYWECLPK